MTARSPIQASRLSTSAVYPRFVSSQTEDFSLTSHLIFRQYTKAMSVLLDSRPQEQDAYDPLAGEEAFEMDDDPLAGEDDEEDPLGGSSGGEHEDGIGKRDSPVDSYATTIASAPTPLDEDESMASSIHDGQDEEDPLGGGDDRPADDEDFDPFGDYESEKRPPRSGASSMMEDTEPTLGMAGEDEEEDPFGAPTRDAGRAPTGPSPLERLAGRLSHEDDDTMVGKYSWRRFTIALPLTLIHSVSYHTQLSAHRRIQIREPTWTRYSHTYQPAHLLHPPTHLRPVLLLSRGRLVEGVLHSPGE